MSESWGNRNVLETLVSTMNMGVSVKGVLLDLTVPTLFSAYNRELEL